MTQDMDPAEFAQMMNDALTDAEDLLAAEHWAQMQADRLDEIVSLVTEAKSSFGAKALAICVAAVGLCARVHEKAEDQKRAARVSLMAMCLVMQRIQAAGIVKVDDLPTSLRGMPN